MYYQNNNKKHHKVTYSPYGRNLQVLLKKKTGNKINKNIAITGN